MIPNIIIIPKPKIVGIKPYLEVLIMIPIIRIIKYGMFFLFLKYSIISEFFSNYLQRLCIRIVRFCVRGFSAGKSDVTKAHELSIKH